MASSTSSSFSVSSLCASFNQDSSHFAVGLRDGFRVYTTDPLRERMRRDFPDGGIGIIEMLERTNWIALVGGGREPKYPQNKVVMWDDVQKRPAFEMEFKSQVLSVRLRRDLIVVVLVGRVHVYRFNNPPHKLHTFETTDNDRGLCALSPSTKRSLLAFPGRSPGHIQLVDLTPPTSNSSSQVAPQHYQNLPTNISLITAHENRLACLAINHAGTLLASASVQGTLLRVWDTRSCACLVELRRGVDRADIHSIAFSPPPPPPSASATLSMVEDMIAVISDKGTIHIFSLAALSQIPGQAERNKQSSFATPILGSLLPKYFQSRWGFGKAHVPVESKNESFKLGWWGEGEGVVVIGREGGWWKFTVPKGQLKSAMKGNVVETEDCKEVGYKRFLNVGREG